MSERTEKRNNFRSESNYVLYFRRICKNEKGKHSEWQRSTTLNISAGGAAIFTETEVKLDEVLEFELLIPGGPIFGLAKVVRLLDSAGLSNAVGIKFISVASHDQDKIARAVLANGLEGRHGQNK